MTSEDNRRAYERFCKEVLGQGNLAALDELVDEDVVSHSPFPGQAPGREGLRTAFAQFRTAFPELEVEVRDMLADGDKVAGYFSVSGVQRGEFMGLPARGQRVRYEEMAIVRFAGGKIVEHWSVADTFAMMQSLGVAGDGAGSSDGEERVKSSVAAERVKVFFERYAERVNRALAGEPIDPKDVADSFASHFVGATPSGVQAGKNGLLFRWMIPRGFAHYRKLGTTAMLIGSLEVEPLDPTHALAKVRWDSRYQKQDGSRDRIDFDVSYLLHFEHGEPKIFAYITGDEEHVLREHGLS